MSASGTVVVEREGEVCVVTINRPTARNAVDRPTALGLADAFRAFDADPALSVAVLRGEGDHFCGGADLKAVAQGTGAGNRAGLALDPDLAADGPMGPTRLALSKPVIAAVEGYAVAGGLELALWCDLRVASATATFGVFCRRFGVPLIDGGTVRLPRLIGESRALDLILTGRPVGADEAFALGLANRVVPAGEARAAAVALAREIAAFPQVCMRHDRASVRAQSGRPFDESMAREFALGLETLRSGESVAGAQRFASGKGRHGSLGS
jgi:enoyl-CoA hydratase